MLNLFKSVAVRNNAAPNLWLVRLPDRLSQLERRLLEVLDDRERARAQSFVFERDQIAFIRVRAGIRLLLGDLLGIEPAALRLGRSQHGKPYVLGPSGRPFNVSHTRGAGLIMIGKQGEWVGVDIEAVCAGPVPWGVLERFFAPEDRLSVERSPPERQQAAFCRLWSNREASLKALGIGMYGLDKAGVSYQLEKLRMFEVELGSDLCGWAAIGLSSELTDQLPNAA